MPGTLWLRLPAKAASSPDLTLMDRITLDCCGARGVFLDVLGYVLPKNDRFPLEQGPI